MLITTPLSNIGKQYWNLSVLLLQKHLHILFILVPRRTHISTNAPFPQNPIFIRILTMILLLPQRSHRPHSILQHYPQIAPSHSKALLLLTRGHYEEIPQLLQRLHGVRSRYIFLRLLTPIQLSGASYKTILDKVDRPLDHHLTRPSFQSLKLLRVGLQIFLMPLKVRTRHQQMNRWRK